MRLQVRNSAMLLVMLAPSLCLAQAVAEAPPSAATATAEITDTVATIEPAQDSTESASNALVAAQATAHTNIAPPPAGKGQVVFFREKKFAGAAVKYKVRESDNELGKLSSGSYFVHVTEPGTHTYTVHSEAKDVLNLEVEAGETYYVLGAVSMGILAGRPNLSPAQQSDFDGMYDKLKPAE